MAAIAGDYVGSRVRITTRDGVYDGILNAVDLNHKRLTLEKVTSCKTGKRVNGLYHFFHYEITDVEIIEDKRKKVKDNDGSFLVTKKQHNPHLLKVKELGRNDMLLSEKAKTKKETKDPEAKQSQKWSQNIPALTRYRGFEEVLENRNAETLALQRWPDHYILINKTDKTYRAAIAHLQNQTLIGLALEGVRMGRKGKISLLQVATRSHVIVFDVLSMGQSLFDDGLGKILEYPHIQKVIHDCRLMSDALFHLYGVKLINVFDTQVSEVMVYKNLHEDLPRYVQSINTLIIQYLNFESDHAYFYRQREESLLPDQKIWLSRPLSDGILEVAVRHAMYLLELRTVMLEKMLQDFTDGVDIYLGIVRDSPEEKIERYERQTHLMPLEMRNINSSAQKYRNIYKERYKSADDGANKVDQYGLRENCIGPLDTNVIYSSDSIWHGGNGKQNQPNTMGRVLQECHRVGNVYQGSDSYVPEEDLWENQARIKHEDEDDSLLSLGMKKTQKVKNTTKKMNGTDEGPFMTVRNRPAGTSDVFDYHDIRLKDPETKGNNVVIVNGEKQPAGSAIEQPSSEALESESGVGSDSSLDGAKKMSGVSPSLSSQNGFHRGVGRSKRIQSLLQGGLVTKDRDSEAGRTLDERFSDSPDDGSEKSGGGRSQLPKSPSGAVLGLGRGRFIGRGFQMIQ